MNTLFAGETCKGLESFRILNSFRALGGFNPELVQLEPLRPKSRGKVVEKLGLVRNLEQERTYQNTRSKS